MATHSVSLPKGTRDFYGEVLNKRQYIIQTIKREFELFGFQPLETPSLENTETLMGKYGDEGDKLIFRIVNNGDWGAEIKQLPDTKTMMGHISDRALRYDLTIPFARFMTMNVHHVGLPFKRYQIQPVWRGDRPQKGRYREFYQCDADVVGSASLINEAELVMIYQRVLTTLQIPQTAVYVNSRKILLALITALNATSHNNFIITTIDKIDKIGIPAVLQELTQVLRQEQVEFVEKFLNIQGTNEDKINQLQALFQDHISDAEKGIAELKSITTMVLQHDYIPLIIDHRLARGLSYYTGIIFEVKTTAVKIGSIGGGGRYDNLTANMGVENMTGVGISFGIDRIYDVMDELQIFPPTMPSAARILFFNMGQQEALQALRLADILRQQGIAVEVYPDAVKLDKQFKYAERKKIPFVCFCGSNEIQSQTLKFKNLHTGQEQSVAITALAHFQI